NQGGLVTTGVCSKSFDDLMDAIDEFCENLEEKQNSLQNEEYSMYLEILKKIEEELKVDADFNALRGKRKRCVYVEEKYSEVLPSLEDFPFAKRVRLLKPDPYSDYMNADIVSMVQRLTDEIELLKRDKS